MPLATTVLTSIPRESESAEPEATSRASRPREAVRMSERARERLQVIERLLDSCQTPNGSSIGEQTIGNCQTVPGMEQPETPSASEN